MTHWWKIKEANRVNYGPYGESNQTARTEDTVFAPQKATILPEQYQDPDIHWKGNNVQSSWWNKEAAPLQNVPTRTRTVPPAEYDSGMGLFSDDEMSDLYVPQEEEITKWSLGKNEYTELDIGYEDMVENIREAWDRATPRDYEEGMGWYDTANKLSSEISDNHEYSVAQMCGVVAALSPQLDWTLNAMYAKLAADYVAQGNLDVQSWMQDPERGIKMSQTYANRQKAVDILLLPDQPGQVEEIERILNAPKTRNFFLNIYGDPEAVTVDVWATRIALGRPDVPYAGPADNMYDEIANAYREVASQVDVTPREVQATTWSVYRNGKNDWYGTMPLDLESESNFDAYSEDETLFKSSWWKSAIDSDEFSQMWGDNSSTMMEGDRVVIVNNHRDPSIFKNGDAFGDTGVIESVNLPNSQSDISYNEDIIYGVLLDSGKRQRFMSSEINLVETDQSLEDLWKNSWWKSANSPDQAYNQGMKDFQFGTVEMPYRDDPVLQDAYDLGVEEARDQQSAQGLGYQEMKRPVISSWWKKTDLSPEQFYEGEDKDKEIGRRLDRLQTDLEFRRINPENPVCNMCGQREKPEWLDDSGLCSNCDMIKNYCETGCINGDQKNCTPGIGEHIDCGEDIFSEEDVSLYQNFKEKESLEELYKNSWWSNSDFSRAPFQGLSKASEFEVGDKAKDEYGRIGEVVEKNTNDFGFSNYKLYFDDSKRIEEFNESYLFDASLDLSEYSTVDNTEYEVEYDGELESSFVIDTKGNYEFGDYHDDIFQSMGYETSSYEDTTEAWQRYTDFVRGTIEADTVFMMMLDTPNNMQINSIAKLFLEIPSSVKRVDAECGDFKFEGLIEDFPFNIRKTSADWDERDPGDYDFYSDFDDDFEYSGEREYGGGDNERFIINEYGQYTEGNAALHQELAGQMGLEIDYTYNENDPPHIRGICMFNNLTIMCSGGINAKQAEAILQIIESDSMIPYEEIAFGFMGWNQPDEKYMSPSAAVEMFEKIADGKTAAIEDDPFNEHLEWEEEEEKSEDDLMRDWWNSQGDEYDKQHRGDLRTVILENGGLRPHRSQGQTTEFEEFSAIPLDYRRRNGLTPDEMAGILNDNYPEFDVYDERTLMEAIDEQTRRYSEAWN